jgi:putative ABC transport system permease protein
MSFIARGAKNAFRNPVRTGSIVVILGLSVGLAITMLLARQAVDSRINSVKSSIGNTINVSPAGAQGFEGGGEPLTDAQVTQITKVAHVTGVASQLQARLATTDTNLVSSIDAGSLGRRNGGGGGTGGPGGAGGGNFTPPVTATGTTDATSSQGTAITMKSGATIDAASNDNVALIGDALATKNNLVVGSTFTAYGTPVTVKGIYDTGTKFGGNTVLFPLATLQRLSSQPSDITSATVKVDSITNVAAATTAIKTTLGAAADVTSAQDTSQQALQPLENIRGITLFSLIGALVAGGVITFLTMIMIVRERRREIGVFKAIGSSNYKIVTQFVSEAMVLTLLGSVVGVIAGALISNSVVGVLVSTNTATATTGGFGGGRGGGGFGRALLGGGQNVINNIHTAIGFNILLYGLLGAVIIAVLGSAIPAYLISKVRPAEVMRGE